MQFFKFQATGNDFIMLDNLSGQSDNLSISRIRELCDRRFGIGADGLIRLQSSEEYDFDVDYFNADGTKSFCGNGARSAVMFARELGIMKEAYVFSAIDGVHHATYKNGLVSLEMFQYAPVEKLENDLVIQTGSPHYIRFTEHLDGEDIFTFGREIRYSDRFREQGINVNLVEITGEDELRMRTYERGVEAETLSCGTGVTAAAIAYASLKDIIGKSEVTVQTPGGKLSVSLDRLADGMCKNIFLTGPATYVFKGEINGRI